MPAGRADLDPGSEHGSVPAAHAWGDPPAGHRDARAIEGRGRPHQERGRPARLGGELEPAPLGQPEAVDLGDAGGDAGGAQRLLERPQARVARTRPDHDQALRREAEPGEAGGVEVAARADPDHRAGSREPAEEHRGESQRRRLGAAQFVDGVLGETVRQDAVDRLDAETEAGSRPSPCRTGMTGQLGTEPGDELATIGGGSGHGRRFMFLLWTLYVRSLF